VVAVNVTEPLPVPEAGLSVNQVAVSVADQVKVPPPVLLILRVWLAGFPPPCCAVNDRLVGLAPMAGGAVTVKVTGTVMVVAPVALRVIVVLYVPAVREPVAAEREMVLLPVPDAGLTVSQVALSLADQVKVPPPVLLILRVWLAGLPPPCWAVKEKLVGLAPIAGGAGAAVTVNVTGTETVVAPVALSVIVVL
jgi:hypothetical protein